MHHLSVVHGHLLGTITTDLMAYLSEQWAVEKNSLKPMHLLTHNMVVAVAEDSHSVAVVIGDQMKYSAARLFESN